ncbi:putative ribonuclease 3-like [Capsicum annuum]|uniref:ribonuclease S-6 n=1 Tax=Capsicum annuum TaxID=4072 RepID=UPI001FB1275A|nr:ribonuclease S-6 [Capsicum annuum]KAF3639456.1 putative ribonuclease 3-like [Capsicum annuum]
MKMKNLISLLLLTLSLFFISVCSQTITQTQFVYRWPETYCKAQSLNCKSKRPLKFTLAKFLGTDSNGNEVKPTCKNKPDWTKLFTNELVTKLDKFWPSLQNKKENTDIWKDAWRTYGCFNQVFDQDPTNYFNKAIELSNKIGDLLQKHLIESDGIVPCDTAIYQKDEILASFKQVSNNKDVFFTCKENGGSKPAFLNEITFCYDKNANNFENCPSTVVKNKNCRIQNIIVPRPLTPALQALQTTGEKLQPN